MLFVSYRFNERYCMSFRLEAMAEFSHTWECNTCFWLIPGTWEE